MLYGMEFCRFFRMLRCVEMKGMGQMSVMGGFFVIASIVVFCSLFVMVGRLFMIFGRFAMVISDFIHTISP